MGFYEACKKQIENSNKKQVDIRWLIDKKEGNFDIKKGEIASASLESAEQFVSFGLAEYVVIPSNNDSTTLIKAKGENKNEEKVGRRGSGNRRKTPKYGAPKKNEKEDNERVEKDRHSRYIYNNNNNIYLLPIPTLHGNYEILFNLERQKVVPACGEFMGRYYFGYILDSRYEVNDRKGGKVQVVRPTTVFIMSDNTSIVKDSIKGIDCQNLLYNSNKWEKSHIQSYLNNELVSKDKEHLLETIIGIYKEHIDFYNDNEYLFMSLWDIGTYLFPLFNSYPYIHLHGFKNSGKSKVMDLSSQITFNAAKGGCMRPATMYRVIEANRPTLYLDEYEVLDDKKRNKDDEELMLMLNMGYKKGNFVYRNEQIGNKWIPTPFDVYCPKMIANISGVVGALSSRCIKLVLLRAKEGDPRANKEINERDEIWQELRNDLYLFALENWQNVKFNYNTIKSFKGISNRDWELWHPLFAIAKTISNDVFETLKEYALHKVNEKNMEEHTNDSWEDNLLDVLENNIKENRFYALKGEITRWLHDKYFSEEQKKSKPSERWVGSILRRMPNLKFRKVNGITQVNLSPTIILNLITRLRADFDCVNELSANKEEIVK